MREIPFEETIQRYEDLNMNWYYKCPYCGEFSHSRKNLRRHVGKIHREKVDDFIMKYRGGRTIPPHGIQELVETPRVQHITLETPRLNISSSSVQPEAKIFHAVCEASCRKTLLSLKMMFTLAVLAGVYIGFGAHLSSTVTMDLAPGLGVGISNLIGGSVFSIGLMLVVFCGAELFTGNNLMILAYFRGDVALKDLLKNWVIVYSGNLVGSILLVSIILGGALYNLGDGALGLRVLAVANGKVNLTFVQLICRGIACNWLVCLAVWLASSSDNPVFKVVACFFPIMAFAASSFEHGVANMYIIPMGILLKQIPYLAVNSGLNFSNLTLSGFLFRNLLPVTIGNIIGGAFFFSTVQWYIHIRSSPLLMSGEEINPLQIMSDAGRIERQGVFLKLHGKLLDYTGILCDEVEMLCHENTARMRLAINIAKNDGQIFERLVEKECKMRRWEEHNEKNLKSFTIDNRARTSLGQPFKRIYSNPLETSS